ncbi:hypothetical protein GCM10011390_20800 [Aureimonas endophytica]|uniref:Antitoxin n=2 Tax=Aureimonas endophytica TaxID=2027858 RepID=A0A916ZKB1_9HYPH|nr:type II toxin-antitoxin system Phd/YefM family antitoxin [Aureimonas endophytica]GGE01789.1 hypothetical protein GCM10011390_20800 [Aureimonas endophytica]
MRSFSTADLNKQVGEVTEAAIREPVFITRRNKPKFVLMSIDHFHKLNGNRDPRRAGTLETMPDDLFDEFEAAVEAYGGEGGEDRS